VIVTDDFGKTWRRIDAGLPDRRSYHVIREHPDNPDLLVLGTENALWLSLDRGATWTRLHGEGLPTVPINDIKIHRREKDLVLGTHGLSIWVLDGAGWLSQLTAEVLEKPLHLFTVPDCRQKFFLEYSGLWTHKLFRAPNPPMGVRIDYWIAEYTGDDMSITIENSDGVVMKKLGGSNAPGYNRVTWDLTPEDWLRLPDRGEDLLFMPFQLVPGTYTVKLLMGKLKAEGKFQVLPRQP